MRTTPSSGSSSSSSTPFLELDSRFQEAGEEVDDFVGGVGLGAEALAVGSGIVEGVGVVVYGAGGQDGGRLSDAREFVVVEPVEAAGLATVHDDMAAACVEVSFHGAVAMRACDVAIEFVDVGGQCGDGCAGGARRVDEALKLHHGDQHAVAFGAVEQRRAAEGCLPEREVADGTGFAASLFGEHAHAAGVPLRDDDVLAVVAFEAGPHDAHGAAARGTVHWGFPQSGQKLACCGMECPQAMQNLVAPAAGAAVASDPPTLRVDGAPAGADLRVFAITWPMAAPAPRPAPSPAAPPVLAAAMVMAWAAANWLYLSRSPTMFMPMRWSRDFWSSSGSETFSTTNWVSSRPMALKAGFIPWRIFSLSAASLAFMSMKATSLLAKMSVMRAMMVLRSWSSRSAT